MALTPEDQEKAIRQAFYENDNFPEAEELRASIGKLPPKVMDPQPSMQWHDAAALLQHYADHGCPVDCGTPWSTEHLEALLRRGPHISAKSPEAMQALLDETYDKVKNGYARLVRYGDIKSNRPPNLKISPVAMVPHKSRKFRTILDLSFQLRFRGDLLPSVNSASNKRAPAESMIQLGHCIKRLVALLADNYDPNKPFMFSKLDIKDGFWRMSVNEEDAWNFCYVLPSPQDTGNIDDVLLVVPNCLQMGWCESPPFFCAASETARDVIMSLLNEVSLPAHEFEHLMLDDVDPPFLRLHAAMTFNTLLEVFVDDFIAATNNTSSDALRHLSRAMLHGIHSVFPPPSITHHQGEDPISQKKLKAGEGLWSYEKEILGWLVNGLDFTIQLTPEKCQKILEQMKEVIRSTTVPLITFQEVAGKLQHASFGVPGGKGLFSPIYSALKRHHNKQTVYIDPALRQTLQDWTVLIRKLAEDPTPVTLLVPDYPNHISFTDACGLGAGGVITPGMDPTRYWVWQFEWPDYVKKELVTEKTPTGSITINDLELAGMVLGWLAIEMTIPDLSFKHIGLFCDNTSAVSWAFKGSTSTSIPAARLLRLLSLRQRHRQTSSLTPLHIAGTNNMMADVASRAFKEGKFFAASTNLLTYFNSHFPLQTGSWSQLNIHPNLASRVISCLLGKQLPMGQLIRLPKRAIAIGNIGQTTVQTSTNLTLSSPLSQKLIDPSSSQPLQPVYGLGLTEEAIKSRFRQSRTRSRPSPRPQSWLDNKVPPTKWRENTFFPSSDASKASDDKTLPPSHN